MAQDGWIDSWWRWLWPTRSRSRVKKPGDDAFFTDVVSDFSRKLAQRTAERPSDPIAVAQQRQEAIRAYDRARLHRQVMTGCVAVGALMALGLASIAPPIGRPTQPPVSTASAEPAAKPTAAAIAEPFTPSGATTPAPAAPPVRTASLAEPPVAAAATEPAQSVPSAPVESAPPLSAQEVRELQSKLRGFGFNPGPLDGAPGRMTTAAVMNYQQNRGLPQTGTIDRDVLEQVRQDPAPQVAPPAQVAQRPAARQPTRTAYRQPNPVADSLDRLGRFLDSLVR